MSQSSRIRLGSFSTHSNRAAGTCSWRSASSWASDPTPQPSPGFEARTTGYTTTCGVGRGGQVERERRWERGPAEERAQRSPPPPSCLICDASAVCGAAGADPKHPPAPKQRRALVTLLVREGTCRRGVLPVWGGVGRHAERWAQPLASKQAPALHSGPQCLLASAARKKKSSYRGRPASVSSTTYLQR